MSDARRWIPIAAVADCPEGEIRGLTVEGHEIALYHLEGGEFCATGNVCTHGQALLSDGWLVDGHQVECPLHAGCFDVRTGQGMGSPIDEDLKTYPVREEGGQLFVELEG
jgi:naphthalene 1,2-dioxygenase system ferredoxin subunit